ncbi:MAG TPA: AAA family ATPase [Gaiellaceae bacterium]|nr:AAA family ATPase [Gaiellaceae bacterium]
MHLSAIKLRGFKSFPDPVEIRLEPGVAVVVGPNGSGKSNVADAIVWAAGSLAPSELRAEKPDDVMFAGGGERKAADHCEVELLFDNTDGAGPIDFSELSIVRRLHRGGEGQYLVNRAPVRRLDIVELLADLGLGGRMHSIIGQGRVEEILASTPEKRREFVEEAAGLGRFKRRRHRAELKLARVEVQVERARDVEAEVRKRLRPLALQATAAERSERIARDLAAHEARIAALDLAACDDRLGETEERRLAARLARRSVEERLEGVLVDREAAEEELADAAGRREAATAALYRLTAARERLALRREQAEGLRVEAPDGAGYEGPSRAALTERARLARERLAVLERSLAEREGLPPAARSLAEQGCRLALDGLDVEPGHEKAVAASLAWRASALVADDAQAALGLLQQARSAGLGTLVVVTRPPEPLPVVPLGELLSSPAPAVTREGFGYDPARGELWFAGETAEAVLLELEARRRALAAEADELEAAAERAPETAPSASIEPATARRLNAGADRLLAGIAAADAVAARLEAPLRARVDAGATRTQVLAARLRELGGTEADLRRAASDAAERVAEVDVERARLQAEAGEARRRLEAAGAEPVEGVDREALTEQAERLRRRLEALGQVNPFAKEEYAAEKERLEELTAQREDLEASLHELAQLRDDLTQTVETRFEETFAAVRRHFTDVAATLFPGGEGRLELAEDGIEVHLRPAGKRITRLSLLSGGEKALGAISFLFALFLARPCPFYLLDEVEAALDDTNIGRFVELLRRYAEQAQFVVITHQKRTMEAADVLYGVTMGSDGISQVVSRRLPQDDRAALASA